MPISLNPGIRTLILKYNAFHTVDASFNFYSELELVDLSHNGIVSVPPKGFKSQRNLVDLRLNDNKIGELGTDTFYGLRKLESLELRRNFISSLPENCFTHLQSLEVLDLGKNRISDISPDAFVGLSELRVLKLDDNNLNRIPDGLQHLTGLAELHLSRNKIRIVPDAALMLPSLSLLDLSSNKIEKVHEKSFQELGNLRTMKVQDNSLYEVPNTALAPLNSLEILLIGQNMFGRLQKNSFAELPQLKKLDISGCPALTHIENEAFASNSDLREVVISSNRQLQVIEPQAFTGIPDLERVDLSNNQLDHIPPSLLQWQRLNHFQVSGNPLHCDCANFFLKDVIYTIVNSSETVRVVRCWTPLHLRDQDLALLQLQCDVTSSSRIQDSDLLTVIIVASIVSVFIVVSLLLIFVRLRKSKYTQRVPVKDKDILQYEEAEPRYVSPYLVKPNVVSNPYHETMVRNDHYFTTLARLDPAFNPHKAGLGRPVDQMFVNTSSSDSSFEPVFREQIYSDPNLPAHHAVGTLIRINPKSHYEDPISIL